MNIFLVHPHDVDDGHNLLKLHNVALSLTISIGCHAIVIAAVLREAVSNFKDSIASIENHIEPTACGEKCTAKNRCWNVASVDADTCRPHMQSPKKRMRTVMEVS